jgi:hypothetical protein
MQATQRLLHTTAKQLPRSLSHFHTSYFHSSAAVMVKAGDSIPDIELTEGNPGNKVNLSKELGSGLIIGVPAAFSKCPVNSRLVALSFVQPQQQCYSDQSVLALLPSVLRLQLSHSNLPALFLTNITRPNMLRLPCPKLHHPPQA